MQIHAKELPEPTPPAPRRSSLKFLINASGIVFADPSVQHSSIHADGIYYSDEGGNALAGNISNTRVDIRGHQKVHISAERLKTLWQEVVTQCPSLAGLPMLYQGAQIYTPRNMGAQSQRLP